MAAPETSLGRVPSFDDVWHDADIAELVVLLGRYMARGRDSFTDQRLEQLVRRKANRGEGPELLCERLQEASDQLAQQAEQRIADDARARFDSERRLRRASLELCSQVASVFAASSRQMVSAMAVADHALQRRVDALAALQAINGVANSSLDLRQILHLVTQGVQQATNSDLCSIYLFDAHTGDLVLSASTGLAEGAINVARMKVGEGITGSAASIGRPVAVRDAWIDPRFKYIPESGEDPYRSMLSVPVLLFTVNKLVGVLNVQTFDYRDWGVEEISLLETIAGQIAMAIENARLYGQTDSRLRRKIEELTNLRRLSALAASTLGIDDVLDTMLTQIYELSKADMAAILERNASDEFYIVASRGLSEQYRKRVRVREGESVIGEAAKTRQPIQVVDALNDPRLRWLSPEIEEEGFRSLLCIPLTTKRGAIGGVCLYSREPRVFSEEEIEVLTAFANEAAIALENAHLYDEVSRGLATKSTLLAELHHRVKNNLQTIAALLSMQQRRSKSDAERAAFGESVSRVQSMAAIHDLLSHEDTGATSVEGIARIVVTSATSALSNMNVHVTFRSECDDALIPSREATVLALVLNELVTNSILHGFEGRDGGNIVVDVERLKQLIRVRIEDDGVGLPSGFDPERHGGLGVQIVKTLVLNDLKGSYSLEMRDGKTVASVVFPGVSAVSTA